MKHPILDRILMLLFALAALCVCAFGVLLVIGKITPTQIIDLINAHSFTTLKARAVLIGGSVIAGLLGLMMLCAIFPGRRKRSSAFAVQKNENGMVRISVKALDTLVHKCLKEHEELTIVSSTIFSDEETVRVDAHIQLQQDISMPLAISSLQQQIKKYLEACSGVSVQEVRVVVDGVTDEAASKKSPYTIPESMIAPEPLSASRSDFDFAPVVEDAPSDFETPLEPREDNSFAESVDITASTAENTSMDSTEEGSQA